MHLPMHTPPAAASSFLRESVRFASTSAAKVHAEAPRSVFQSLAISAAFRNAGSSRTPTTLNGTLIAMGTVTTCMIGPLLLTHTSASGGPSSYFASTRIAHCAPAAGTPMGVRSGPAYDAYGLENEPLINSKELTFGMAMGLCSGYLMKKLGKMMMLVVGLGFVSLQLLANSGYITVNWVKFERRFKDQFDVDRDGKVTMNDAKHGFRWLIGLLTRNFQFKSTFVGGFVLGFRYA
ncbi:FUN14 domain-containing protein 1 [Mortierella claussenii]|nr:FUN14 domain-containing protein 1 [Mortierella claussenii]